MPYQLALYCHNVGAFKLGFFWPTGKKQREDKGNFVQQMWNEQLCTVVVYCMRVLGTIATCYLTNQLKVILRMSQ